MSGPNHYRNRGRTVSFRMSPDEYLQLQARVKTSGLPTGRYIIESVLHQKICITAGKYQSDRLSLELKRLRLRMEQKETDEADKTEAYLECKALLQQLLVLTNKSAEHLDATDFTTEMIKE